MDGDIDFFLQTELDIESADGIKAHVLCMSEVERVLLWWEESWVSQKDI